MKWSRVIFTGGVVLVGAVAAGCAAGTTQPMAATSCGSNYTCLKDTAFGYHQQAAKLTALAQRYEVEAEAKARELGQNAEQVKQSRDLAMQYWSEAQQADEMARQYSSQLPHNVVY